jgi:hypothetical protein
MLGVRVHRPYVWFGTILGDGTSGVKHEKVACCLGLCRLSSAVALGSWGNGTGPGNTREKISLSTSERIQL